MNTKNIIGALVAITVSTPALALDFDGIYVVGGVGVGTINDSKFSDQDDGENTNDIFIPGLEARADFAWRGGVGIWLLDNFAIEANYMGMSNHTDKISGVEGDTIPGPADHFAATLKTSSLNFWDLTGLGRFFLAEDLWLYGRIGIGYADRIAVETITDDSGFVVIQDTDDNGGLGFAAAIGGQYDMNEWLGVRVEASTIQGINDNIVYVATGNIVLTFEEFL